MLHPIAIMLGSITFWTLTSGKTVNTFDKGQYSSKYTNMGYWYNQTAFSEEVVNELVDSGDVEFWSVRLRDVWHAPILLEDFILVRAENKQIGQIRALDKNSGRTPVGNSGQCCE